MFHFLTRLYDYIFHNYTIMSRESDLELKLVGSLNIAHLCATLFHILGEERSLARRKEYVCN